MKRGVAFFLLLLVVSAPFGAGAAVPGSRLVEPLFLPLVLGPTGAPAATPTPTVSAQPTETATQTPTPTPTSEPTATPTSEAPTGSDLRIIELQFSSADEFVRIGNDGVAPQDMSGWRLHSVVGNQWYSFPAGYSLAPGAQVRVHSGQGALDAPPQDLLWTRAYMWNNDGDEAELMDDSSQVVDRWSYGGS